MYSVSKLRFWVQKVLPLVYDDSLSYYELLCKVVNKLNEVVDNNSDITVWIEKHETDYEGLSDKVDGLINSLVDVVVPWDSSVAYKIYSLVEYQGQNYIALKDVPIGTMITNTDYWQPADNVVEQINAIGVTVDSISDTLIHYPTFSDVPSGIDTGRVVFVGTAKCKVVENETENSYTIAYGNKFLQIIFDHVFYTSWNPDASISEIADDLYQLNRNIKLVVDDDRTESETIVIPSYIKLCGNNTGTIESSANPIIKTYIDDEDVPTEPYDINKMPSISDIRIKGDGTNTAIQIGDRTLGSAQGLNKSAINNVYIYNIRTGIHIIPVHTYIWDFYNIIIDGVRTEQEDMECGILAGDGDTANDSGERFSFFGCNFGTDTILYCNNYGAGQFTFVGCSFDFFTNVIAGTRKFYFPPVFTSCHFETDRNTYDLIANDNDVSMYQCDLLYNMTTTRTDNEFTDTSDITGCVFTGKSPLYLPPRVYTNKTNNRLTNNDKEYALPIYDTFEIKSDTTNPTNTTWDNDEYTGTSNGVSANWSVSNITTPWGKGIKMIALTAVGWAVTFTPNYIPTIVNGIAVHPIISTNMSTGWNIFLDHDGTTVSLKRSYMGDDETNYNVTWYATIVPIKDPSTIKVRLTFDSNRSVGQYIDFGGLMCVLF